MLKLTTFSVTLAGVVITQLPSVAKSAPLANLVLACPDESAIGQDFDSCRGYEYELPTQQRIVFSPARLWSRASDLTASDLVLVCTIPVEPGAYSSCRDVAGLRRTAYVAKAFIDGPVLYVANNSLTDGRIERIALDAKVRETIRYEVGRGLRGIAIDVGSNSLFWTDVASGFRGDGHIERIDDLNASSDSAPSTTITSGLPFPFGIDVSSSAKRLFWADQALSQVETSNLDGTGRSVLFSAVTGAVAVDEVNRKVYAEDRASAARGSIVRSNYDGTGFETVISDVPSVFNLAIDPLHEVIYWTSSAGLESGNGGVYRVNFDGTDFAEIFVMGSNLDTGGIALDLSNGKVYWGQAVTQESGAIYRMNLDGSDPEVFETGVHGAVDMLIVSLHSIPVRIDIKPRDEHNVINTRSSGGVLVAVLFDTTNATPFDALQLDIATVQFGPGGATPNQYRVRDVNSDGAVDLVVQFSITDTGIRCGDQAAALTGVTFDGRKVTGTDFIKTAGCGGHNER